jgi:MshEN domain
VKLGDWLLSKGKITEEHLAKGLQDQGIFGGRLGNSLVKLGYVDEDILGEYLADISRTRYAPSSRLEEIPPDAIAAVPGRLAARYRIVPIGIEGRKLQLAMRDPKDLIALDEIAFLTGLTIEPFVATEFRIIRAIERYYKISLGTKAIPLTDGSADPLRPGGKARPGPAKPAAPPSPSAPEIGLDGLPLDADAEDFDQPFISTQATVLPQAAAPDEPLPTSLAEWREAQQEIPEVFPEPVTREAPGAVTATRSLRQTITAPPLKPSREPQAVSSRPAIPPVSRRPVAVPPLPPSEQTMETTSARLRSADTRDDVFDAVLDFTAARFRRAALFVVQQDRILGWSGRGEGVAPARIRNVMVPLDRPSLFIFFRSGGDYYYGPVPDLPANARFYLDLGYPPPARVLLLPLTIKERAAVILYADHGSETGPAPDIQLYRRLLQKAALALEVLILRNKIMMI